MATSEDILASLRASAFDREEGGRVLRCLTTPSISAAAREHGVAEREVSILALENGMVPLRYVKNLGTIGAAGQARLLGSRVLVVGAGGIGGAAVELLARSGIGTIILVDPDIFDETNLNRQNFCCSDVIGEPKVDVAGLRVRYINEEVDVIKRRITADADNLPELLTGCDVAIDALDNMDDRLVLQEACAQSGVVMVHGAIAGSALQLTTIFPGDVGLKGLVPVEATGEKSRGIETETGNPSTTPMLCAAAQVQEAVKAMLDIGTTLRGRLLYLDMADWSIDLIEL